jgi:hypothetical protein
VLPDGGYVVVHSGRYVFDDQGDPIGATAYLSPGEHRDVAVPITDRGRQLAIPGSVAAVAHRDDGDKALTRFEDDPTADPPYRADGAPVDATARVTVPTSTVTATPSPTPAPATETPAPTVTATADGGGGLSLLDLVGLGIGAVLLIVAGGILATGRGES